MHEDHQNVLTAEEQDIWLAHAQRGIGQIDVISAKVRVIAAMHALSEVAVLVYPPFKVEHPLFPVVVINQLQQQQQLLLLHLVRMIDDDHLDLDLVHLDDHHAVALEVVRRPTLTLHQHNLQHNLNQLHQPIKRMEVRMQQHQQPHQQLSKQQHDKIN